MLSEVGLFVTLVRAGSLAKAGKALNMPASTLSRRIQAFERRLGTTLFFRSTKALRCTCDGESLYAACKDSVDQLNIALSSVQREKFELKGKVRVQLPSSFVECEESHPLLNMHKTNPGIRIEYLVNDQEPDLFGEGIDLLIHAGELKSIDCVTRKLFDTQLKLFATPDYIELKGRPANADSLLDHEVLHDSSLKECVLQDQDGTPVYVPRQERLLTRSGGMLMRATRNGMGVGLLPVKLARPYVNSGALVQVLPELSMAGRSVYISYLSSRSLSVCARAVLDQMLAITLPLHRDISSSCNN